MALILTPEVFFELMTLCLSWEWEKAVDRAEASHNREQPLYPTQLGWTTVDKIVRILHGLGIVNKKQKLVLYKDRRLQYLVLHRSEVVLIGDGFLDRVLKESRKDLVLHRDAVESINREKMLRNMRFYVTVCGHTKAKLFALKYKQSVTKECYFAEIERQDDLLPRRPGAVENVMMNYRQRVEEETKPK